jgi:hypothetical protein
MDDLVGYSITLSARTNNASGTVTPIALAVLRLIGPFQDCRLTLDLLGQTDLASASKKALQNRTSPAFAALGHFAGGGEGRPGPRSLNPC